MKTIKVLVIPAGTEIAFEIHDALKYIKFIELYGATSVDCHASFVFERIINNFPFPSDISFIDRLNEIVDNLGIDIVYPAHDDVCLKLAEQLSLIHCKVAVSSPQTMEITRSKIKTYDFFENNQFIPKHYKTIDECENYPIVAKPDIGQGSQGVFLLNNRNEWDAKKINTTYVFCEYLPGEEYTIDCFTNYQHELITVSQRTRERIRSGISVRSKMVEVDPVVYDIANSINILLEMNGAWFFQLKKDSNNNYKLLEIGARVPGTMCVSRNLGVNYPLLTIYNLLHIDVSLLRNNYDIMVDRAFINRFNSSLEYNKVYIDFDDTIVVKGKINLTCIVFLYQCVNNNIDIVLLTKHRCNIFNSLSEFKISTKLFSQIIVIDNKDDKVKYINPENAIFIDDSFSERKIVKEAFNIPVFDLDMIEMLLDWRL